MFLPSSRRQSKPTTKQPAKTSTSLSILLSIFKRIVNEGTWTGAELISLIWNSFMFPLCVFRLYSMVARTSMLCEIGEVKPWVLKWKQETRWKNRMEVENWINKHRKIEEISTRVWDTETVKLDELKITQLHCLLDLSPPARLDILRQRTINVVRLRGTRTTIKLQNEIFTLKGELDVVVVVSTTRNWFMILQSDYLFTQTRYEKKQTERE